LLFTTNEGCLVRLGFLFKIKAGAQFYHRHIIDISISHTSLIGGKNFKHNANVGQKAIFQDSLYGKVTEKKKYYMVEKIVADYRVGTQK